MYCPKCGKELPDGAAFCSSCGTPVAAGVTPTPTPAPAPKKSKKPLIAAIAGGALLLIILFAAMGGSSSTRESGTSNSSSTSEQSDLSSPSSTVAQDNAGETRADTPQETAAAQTEEEEDFWQELEDALEDPHVLMVKRGSPVKYPQQTYGSAFDNFFAYPYWTYFVGTKEWPDEDQDGLPDAVEEDVDIVQFTGNCMYMNVEVEALIQFTLDTESDTFMATYLSFNDVPQTLYMLEALLDMAFAQDREASAGTQQDNFPSTSAESESDLSAFLGEWESVEDFYPVMEITELGGGQCQITITHRYAQWDAVATYEDNLGRLMYDDGVYSSIDRAAVEKQVEATDCSGMIWEEAPDALVWYNADYEYEEYFIRTGSPLVDITLNGITYQEAIAEGWGDIWYGVAEHMGTDGSLQEEAASGQYGGSGNAWDDFDIDGIPYELAQKYGWGDAWMAFANYAGTG